MSDVLVVKLVTSMDEFDIRFDSTLQYECG